MESNAIGVAIKDTLNGHYAAIIEENRLETPEGVDTSNSLESGIYYLLREGYSSFKRRGFSTNIETLKYWANDIIEQDKAELVFNDVMSFEQIEQGLLASESLSLDKLKLLYKPEFSPEQMFAARMVLAQSKINIVDFNRVYRPEVSYKEMLFLFTLVLSDSVNDKLVDEVFSHVGDLNAMIGCYEQAYDDFCTLYSYKVLSMDTLGMFGDIPCASPRFLYSAAGRV